METILDLRLAGGGDRGFGMAADGGDRRVWDRWELGFFFERERERLHIGCFGCFGFLGF